MVIFLLNIVFVPLKVGKLVLNMTKLENMEMKNHCIFGILPTLKSTTSRKNSLILLTMRNIKFAKKEIVLVAIVGYVLIMQL